MPRVFLREAAKKVLFLRPLRPLQWPWELFSLEHYKQISSFFLSGTHVPPPPSGLATKKRIFLRLPLGINMYFANKCTFHSRCQKKYSFYICNNKFPYGAILSLLKIPFMARIKTKLVKDILELSDNFKPITRSNFQDSSSEIVITQNCIVLYNLSLKQNRIRQ